MIELIAQNLAPIMFLSMVGMLLMGYPVAFTLAANGLLFFVIGVELAPLAPDTINLSWPLLQAMPGRVLAVMSNEILLAVPFFTFMGYVLERSGMAEDLLDTAGHVFGTVRGGLAYAAIFVGALLAATTGVVAASVISMGLISLPIMLRYGYERRVATGVITASGTLAQIIPPSLVLIVLADQLGQSVGDMYRAAFVPGVMLAGLYAGYIFLISVMRPAAVPGLPPEAVGHREADGSRGIRQLGALAVYSGALAIYLMRFTQVASSPDYAILTICLAIVIALSATLLNRLFGPRRILLASLAAIASIVLVFTYGPANAWAAIALEVLAVGSLYAAAAAWFERALGLRLISTMAEQVTFVLVPPLLLIFLALGTIFIGVATPTEGGAMGAVGALVLAAVKRRLDRNPGRFNFKLIKSAAEATARLTTFAIFILIGARVFSLTFYSINGHLWVEHLLTSLPGGVIGFLIITNLLVFVLGFFLDFLEIAFILIPLLAPAATILGIDLIFFGILLSLNLQTSFLSPPFGFALFYLRSVAPKLPFLDRVTGKQMKPVTTGQIYAGVIPFVAIQLLMLVLIALFPDTVLHHSGAENGLGAAEVNEKIDELFVPEGGQGELPPLFD
ncbi:TRAP transporter large permease [Rhodoligotrophos defluvii]|uniref:TRAP transporter large permease n=1 Tax=Rhodoligotrophos defluvii TaxID=2561934 RepID=UPI0010C9E1A4|nr:TRAP transporter large permease subunit [Rhodoligotrophos defluvii]